MYFGHLCAKTGGAKHLQRIFVRRGMVLVISKCPFTHFLPIQPFYKIGDSGVSIFNNPQPPRLYAKTPTCVTATPLGVSKMPIMPLMLQFSVIIIIRPQPVLFGNTINAIV